MLSKLLGTTRWRRPVSGDLSQFLARKTWGLWEAIGFHLVPDHYYYPTPDMDDLREKQPWDETYPTAGIDLREEAQVRLVEEVADYIAECSFSGSETFDRIDGLILYALIREYSPDRIIEVGSGTSTEVALRASAQNERDGGTGTDITAVEPYPDDSLRELAAENERLTLLESRAEDVETDVYLALEAGDFLFIDSSHMLTIGNDVAHLYLRVLPQLSSGVLVHIHDIFFPAEYPRRWAMDMKRFFTEQYLLQAFLMFNESFEVVWSGSHMYDTHYEDLESVFRDDGDDIWGGGGSFWVRRVD